MRYSFSILGVFFWLLAAFAQAALSPQQLGVVINLKDPHSVDIGRYYQEKRQIPDENLIYVSFEPGQNTLPVKDFQRIKQQVDQRTPNRVQAFALTWSKPFRVGCMSITSAFAFGFHEHYCAVGCVLTKPSPYFDSNSKNPFYDLGIRPAMSLAGATLDQQRALIRRGLAADLTRPMGKGFLLKTSDKHRNVRALGAEPGVSVVGESLLWSVLERDAIQHQKDVLFYFTGLKEVPHLTSNGYLPGAIGDHLTSHGGSLYGSSQMSSLRWLEAGLTGSYGTVNEPCNFREKFPVPQLVAKHYLKGDTLIEAYWKSVRMPGQGIFIGEPLARPYGQEPATPR